MKKIQQLVLGREHISTLIPMKNKKRSHIKNKTHDVFIKRWNLETIYYIIKRMFEVPRGSSTFTLRG
jgi:hypothetical protein